MPHTHTLDVGDTVMLKSGGPVMTVHKFNPNSGDAICQWFDAKDEMKAGAFSIEMLKPVNPPR